MFDATASLSQRRSDEQCEQQGVRMHAPRNTRAAAPSNFKGQRQRPHQEHEIHREGNAVNAFTARSISFCNVST